MSKQSLKHTPIEEQPTSVIRPATGSWRLPLNGLVKYRSLIYSMARRRVRLRYGDLTLGIFWAVARPLLMVAVFVLLRNMSQAVFGIGIPYLLYLYSGLILWFYFLEVTTSSAGSIQANAGLVRKVYYPHLINPLVPIVSGLADLGVTLVPLIAFMLWFGEYPGWHLVLLPLVIIQCMALALGTGLLFAALRLNSPDWERLLGLILYVGLFLSPVIYSPSIIPERAQMLYHANPMSGTLLAFRATLFDGFPFPAEAFLYSCAFTATLLIIGIYCFGRAEKYLLDHD